MNEALEERLGEVCRLDPRYTRNAYLFVLEALDRTIQRIEAARTTSRHVGGKDLLEGIRDFGRERFGPMAKEVFNHWGVLATEDFGQIVFNMISIGLLQRRPQDSIHDFADGYDFERVFERDYRVRVPWEELSS
ncbi:MAG TPA: hypothetical protein PKE00_16905 [Planctomycetota bacterium]|nr:hypothetical protein [Planctomycetota bacterium]